MNIIPFNPPQIKLMGPGPSDVYPRVLSALSRPTLGHLDPLFIKMMDETKYLMQSAFQTKNSVKIHLLCLFLHLVLQVWSFALLTY